MAVEVGKRVPDVTLVSSERKAVRTFGIEDPNFINGLLPGVAKRSVFVLDKGGTVTYRWVSDNPGVEPNYQEVEAAVRKITTDGNGKRVTGNGELETPASGS